MTVDMSFSHLGWDQVVAKSHASADFKRSFQQAVKICKGEKPKTFAEETVTRLVTGFTVERQYILVSDAEFLKSYGCKPQAVDGIMVERFINEAGVPANFVIMNDDGKNPGAKKLRVHSSCDVGAHETVMAPASQLRQGQAFDVKDFYEQDWRKVGVPKTLYGGTVAPDNDALSELVKAHFAKMEQARVASELAASLPTAAPVLQPQPPAEEKDESEESEFEHASTANPIALPSERQWGKQSKGQPKKGQSKGEKDGRGKRQRQR